MVTLDPSLYEKHAISSWDSLWKAYKDIRARRDHKGRRIQWIFRGHGKASWPLQSTLERTILEWSGARRRAAQAGEGGRRRSTVTRTYRESLRKGLDGCSVPVIEHRLIREFRRRAHHYPNISEPTEFLEWLALMRHYGAPVRLLDWTYSFWVGLHFALNDAAGSCALWALDSDWVGSTALALLPYQMQSILKNDPQLREGATFVRVFLAKNPPPFVVPVNPMRLNERLAAQRGVFLCPGDISLTFEQNLAGILRQTPRRGTPKLMKFTIPDRQRLRREIRLHLDQMNISEAVLFPGLDGYARSLHHKVVDADLFKHSGATAWFERLLERGRWSREDADLAFTQ